jgi:glycosyltransferase involved in cell wall biosynthesis
MDVIGGTVSMLTGTPHLLSERSAEPAYEPGWRRAVREWIGQRAAAIVANSEVGLDYWNRIAARPIKCVIGNALPLEQLAAIAAAGSSQAHQPIVMSAGRFSPEKNTLALLRAMAHAARKRADVRFRIFGDGPELPSVLALRDHLGMRERIEILPYTVRLWEEMSTAALFVSASLFEGSPNTVLEAAAVGCPLVLSPIPAHRELFDDQAAWFFADSSAEQIAAAIELALENAAVARARATRARAAIAGRSIAAVCAEYQQIYRRVLQDPAKGGEPERNSC